MLCRICMFVFAPQPDHLVDALHLRQEGQEQEGWAQRVAGMARSNSRPTDTGLIDRFSSPPRRAAQTPSLTRHQQPRGTKCKKASCL